MCVFVLAWGGIASAGGVLGELEALPVNGGNGRHVHRVGTWAEVVPADHC